MEINGIEFSLDNIFDVEWAEQLYGDGKYVAIHYYGGETVLIPVKDYEEYTNVSSSILEALH